MNKKKLVAVVIAAAFLLIASISAYAGTTMTPLRYLSTDGEGYCACNYDACAASTNMDGYGVSVTLHYNCLYYAGGSHTGSLNAAGYENCGISYQCSTDEYMSYATADYFVNSQCIGNGYSSP